jgi:nucleotide-binding universal stress UspA family protein
LTGIIVSYDGTPNDDDALALGALLARGGGTLALAYVRHSREYDPRRERLAQHDAEQRLAQGAAWLGDEGVPRHVVVSASTGAGLGRLAEQERASVIVFGSDYRTPRGRVEPGTSAQQLLEGGPVAIAVAPAGLRTDAETPIASVAIVGNSDDPAVQDTAKGLVAALGAELLSGRPNEAGLVVVGSQASAQPGRIALSGTTRQLLEAARSPVLVLPRGRVVSFNG